MKLYFALTQAEVRKKLIHYPATSKYSHKGVHVDLESLRAFIKKMFKDHYKSFSYVELDTNLDWLEIDLDVYVEDMISVKLPINIDLTNKDIKRLF
jgi:hypothetical protein